MSDLRDGGQALLEVDDGGGVFTVHGDLDEDLEAQADRGGADDGATGNTSGLSWSWAVLTAVNIAAWTAYFTLAAYPTALIPSSSVTLLAGTLAVMLAHRG